MASWDNMPDASQGDPLAYTETWENRIGDCDECGTFGVDTNCKGQDGRSVCDDCRDQDVEYADEDEAGQLGLGVPGEQRAIPTLARRGLFDLRHDLGRAPTAQEWMDERR